MIVKNEAHIVHELVESVAPYIDTWVVVDTGSTDGTQEKLREYMAERGIPGVLYERPWVNFGFNRTEALQLAQGHADYIWVMDADDIVSGQIDFSNLTADGYHMRIESPGVIYWRRQLFRNGVPFRYAGVVHEYALCDEPFTEERLEGNYTIKSRRLGGRNLDPEKYHRDVRLLQAEIERDPTDSRSVFYLARSYNSLLDWANARDWYLRRAEMGDWAEEVFYSLWRAGTAMQMLGQPWPEVQDQLMRAWEYRPSRCEPLHDIAVHYRQNERFLLGHFFAERAAKIPWPTDDTLFIDQEVYQWRALDEQAVCAAWTGRPMETFEICNRILLRSDIPDAERTRIEMNRDVVAQQLRNS